MSPTAEPIHDTTATCQDAGTLMATFGITQEPGPYVYGGHRYDKLTDAVHYAQRQQASRAAPIRREGADGRDARTLMAMFGAWALPDAGPYLVYGEGPRMRHAHGRVSRGRPAASGRPGA